MGPFLLIDKNVLQGLSYQEIITMRRHYTVIISPILIQEIIGNLFIGTPAEKESREKVKSLASRSHGFHVYALPYFKLIENSDLINGDIKFKPPFPRFGGKRVVSKDGKEAIVFPESIEEYLLRKWGVGDFDDLDKRFSKLHQEHKQINLEKVKVDSFKNRPKGLNFKSLEEIVRFVDEFISRP